MSNYIQYNTLMKRSQNNIISNWQYINGLRIFVRSITHHKSQNTLPIILIHGLSISSSMMVPLMKSLSPYFAVYALDLPGFGRSENPQRILSTSELADILALWV